MMPFFKLFIWSFLRSLFNLFVFQTPYLTDFVWRIYLIYSAESGFKGFYVSKSEHFFNNFTLKVLKLKIFKLIILTILFLTINYFMNMET